MQDFDFPEASNKIKTTSDGQYVIATGTYKPRMKVFDLEELSLKTERVTDSENIDFCVSGTLCIHAATWSLIGLELDPLLRLDKDVTPPG